ncbi:MAG: general stress protein [Rhodobacteraceae bacterium]|nr:MAG: general stress protein [Paracoccaceae bacterium]
MTDKIDAKEFWNQLDNVMAGMLTLEGARPVPMSPYSDREAGAIWFITARGTDVEEALRGGAKHAQFIVASGDAQIYANIEGTARIVQDPSKLDEIWNAVADAWFEGGEADPDVTLVRFDLSDAEAWTTGGKLGFLYEIAKAQVTDEKPDMGAHGRLNFAA